MKRDYNIADVFGVLVLFGYLAFLAYVFI